jgi:hypothetical protein
LLSDVLAEKLELPEMPAESLWLPVGLSVPLDVFEPVGEKLGEMLYESNDV